MKFLSYNMHTWINDIDSIQVQFSKKNEDKKENIKNVASGHHQLSFKHFNSLVSKRLTFAEC